jgi:hypothetical protein
MNSYKLLPLNSKPRGFVRVQRGKFQAQDYVKMLDKFVPVQPEWVGTHIKYPWSGHVYRSRNA